MALVTVSMKAMCPKSLEAQGLLQKGHGLFQLLETAAGRSEEKLCTVQEQETPAQESSGN